MAGRKSITETGDAGAQPVPEVVEFTMASIVTGPAGFTSLAANMCKLMSTTEQAKS
jgi:hypothetical protein